VNRDSDLAALSCCNAFKKKVKWLPGVMLPGVAIEAACIYCEQLKTKDGKTLDKMARNGIESRFSADDCNDKLPVALAASGG